MVIELKQRKNLDQVIQSFDIVGSVRDILPFGNGHINETFRLVNEVTSSPDYLLQRINHNVFTNVSGMMNNIVLVTDHLREAFHPEEGQMTLELIKSKKGELFVQDHTGNYWRIFDFKEETKTYDIVETEEQAYQGARAFGLFFSKLESFDAKQLAYTIPDFHNVILRLEQLKSAVDKYSGERLSETKEDLKIIFELADQMCQIEKKKQSNVLPLRVTHNDTKFNNVLLDANDRGICVIDLDTVMPGVVHYDFGDGVRTVTNSAAEDEKDLSMVQFDFEKYKAFATGYLEVTSDILNPSEIELLGVSGAVISYIMAVRFMTDYISNDIYYKTKYPKHNLDRARCQLKLAQEILGRLSDINLYTCYEATAGFSLKP